ncbi:GNAT family N-acetyltransferase [Patulibacter americanus]|uniref:GNAT family N-acetyltransferase n=1 Tax=Patulibacter americanus TaxID=588672 RepID=UPI0003B6CFCB|nr:GNAT family N-acetyltransferase [Patulibacter americanus]
MELRDATPDDAQALAGLVLAVAHHAYADLEPMRVHALEPEDEAAEWRARLEGSVAHVVRIGSVGGRTVAASCWRLPEAAPDGPAAAGTLTHLMVHPAAQNAGVGSVLLGDAEDTLRSRGVTAARLSLHRDAWWAERFLSSRGWQRDEEHPADDATSERWRRSL